MVRTEQRQLTSFDEQSQPVHDSSLQPVIACFRGLVAVLVFLLLVQTFLVEGLLTRLVVSSASMSPALRGPHDLLHCPNSATVFCVETEDDANALPNDRPLRWGTCPACAFARVPVPADARRMGDRILVNRAALSLRAVRRWDVVLFRSPDDGTLAVKRVVGLPGETLEIHDGDISINGRIAAKPYAVQKAMRVPVLYGRWETQPGGFPGTCELAWQPIRNAPHFDPFPATEYDAMPGTPLYGVTNQLCENQWRIERPGGIFPVRDLMLEFEWRPEAATKPLCVTARSGEHRFEVLFDSERKSVTVSPDKTQRPYGFKRPVSGTYKITVSLFDRHLLVAVNDAIIVELPFEAEAEGEPVANEPPFAIGFSDTGVSQKEQRAAGERQITNLRVGRDVYYTPRPANASTQTVTVPAGCYYLLGDNSGFSADSRHWNEPFVAYRSLVGIVRPSDRIPKRKAFAGN